MFLIPLNAAHVARHAEPRGKNFKFATAAVEVEGDGESFRLTATDCHVLVQVSGRSPSVAGGDHPAAQPLAAAPNGRSRALVPAEPFLKAAAAGVKLTAGRGVPAGLRTLAVQPSDAVTTVAAAGGPGRGVQVQQIDNADGRFPPAADVIARARRAAGPAVRVDPEYLAEVAATITKFLAGEKSRIGMSCTLTLSTEAGQPVLIEARDEAGNDLVACIMPIT